MGKTNTTVCEKCGKEFLWSVHDGIWPGGKDKEFIICPYCNNAAGSVMTNGFIEVRKTENDG